MTSGPLPAMGSIDYFVCSVVNTGSSAKTIKSLRILDAAGGLVASAACNGNLPPRNSCSADGTVSNGPIKALSCQLVIEESSVSGLKGEFTRLLLSDGSYGGSQPLK